MCVSGLGLVSQEQWSGNPLRNVGLMLLPKGTTQNLHAIAPAHTPTHVHRCKETNVRRQTKTSHMHRHRRVCEYSIEKEKKIIINII